MPSSPAIKARRRLLVMPVTANSMLARAPARAWTRGSPNRKAGALLPSSVTVDCAIRAKAGLARTVPWPTRLSVQQPLVDRTGLGLQAVEVGQQPLVDRTGLGLQAVEVGQQPLAAEVVGVVDHGLDAQGTAVLEVLLDAGVLVEHVDGDAAGVPVDRGLEGAGGFAAAWVAFEDELDAFGASQVEVVGHQRLEEGSGVAGGVQHDGAGGLDLPHGQVPPEPGVTVGGRKRQRQTGHPAFEEHADRAGTKPVTDRLQ